MQEELKKEERSARFSVCGEHRLWLYRIWDETRPMIMFIGLNPSTANETEDDPTIRRVKAMAKAWGYGGVYMMNLFTYISTDPKKLDIINGNINTADFFLKKLAGKSKDVVFAWGNFNVFGRDTHVKAMFPNAKCLHINKNGSPKHPLYCRTDSQLIDFV